MARNKRERIVKSKVAWKKRSQVNRLHIIMTFLLTAIGISVAAGILLAVIEITDPFSEHTASSSAAPVSSSESEADDSLPVYDNSLTLVIANSNQPLPDDFVPQLTEYEGVQLDERIVPALEKMLEAAQADGISLTVTGGYRSPEDQDALFEQKISDLMANGYTRVRAEAEVQSSIGEGGCNEAQTGLSISLLSAGEESLNAEAGRWLNNHSIHYGFVLRFPKGSEDGDGADIRSHVFSICWRAERGKNAPAFHVSGRICRLHCGAADINDAPYSFCLF